MTATLDRDPPARTTGPVTAPAPDRRSPGSPDRWPSPPAASSPLRSS